MNAQTCGTDYVNGKVYDLDLDTIRLDPGQPKAHFDEEVVIEKLSQAIKEHGFFQPVFFRLDDDGVPVLLLGGRRYFAAKRSGMKTIPGVYCNRPNCEVAFARNLMLGDLTAVQEAEALRQALAYRYTYEQLSQALGKDVAHIKETLTITKLPQEILDECRDDAGWNRDVLVAIARQTSPQKMLDQFQQVKRCLCAGDNPPESCEEVRYLKWVRRQLLDMVAYAPAERRAVLARELKRLGNELEDMVQNLTHAKR
ncbi:MAG: ParB/RepB/Spo0J family partition protein [Desulfovibrionaceae bacterium]